MKKRMKRFTALVLAAVTAACAMTTSSSALSVCIGGKCYNFTLPCDLRASIVSLYNKNCTDCTTQSTPAATPSVQTGKDTSVPAGGGDMSASSDVSEVLSLVNSARAANGLGAVTMSSELNAAAEVRAKEIVRSFSHTRPNGTSCFTVLKESGISYRAAGENIAYGQRSASAVMNAWMNSSGHRANILGKNFGKIGIACYTVGGTKYWVQLFTN